MMILVRRSPKTPAHIIIVCSMLIQLPVGVYGQALSQCWINLSNYNNIQFKSDRNVLPSHKEGVIVTIIENR